MKMFKKIFSNQLISGSLAMTIGTGIAGVGNYLYHLLMGRMLGPTDYGILASLISLSYLLSIPTATLNLVLVKFVSAFKGKKDFNAIRGLFKVSAQKILPFVLVFLLIFLILTPFIISFLHLNSSLPFILVLLAFFISVFLTINRAFLQGLLRFGYFSFSSILEIFLKLSLAIPLVIWGFKVNGALFGFLVGGIFGYLFTLIPLRWLFEKKNQKLKMGKKKILSFTLPVFFSTLAFTSLFTSDVVLVRHFLPGQESGFYAALALLGKIIFFATSPIVAVSFPLISERHASGDKYRHLLWTSLGLVGGICFLAMTVYFLFPSFLIKILYGSQYLPAVPFLGIFAVFLTLYSLSFLFVNFFLSIGRVKTVILPVVAGIFQIIFICFFHQNLRQIIFISVALAALLLVSLLLYCLQTIKKN